MLADKPMMRLLHPGLMRGARAQYAAILLLVGLVATLAVSVFHGISMLP